MTGLDTNTPDERRRSGALDVDRRWLFAIAGAIWTGVGILLLGYAFSWLKPLRMFQEIGLVLAGLAVAAVFIRFVFRGIVRKNIDRIEAGPKRRSAFSFQNWKSYLVTVLMIGLGIMLRHSALPKAWLVPVYLGVGLALLLTSLLYHRHLLSHLFGSRRAR
jgi:hypothetical protein